MLEEHEISNEAAIAAIRVIEDEINSRIKHADGDIELLSQVAEALNSTDRIVIR